MLLLRSYSIDKRRGYRLDYRCVTSSNRKHMAALLDCDRSDGEGTGALSSRSPHRYPPAACSQSLGNSGCQTISEQGIRSLSVGREFETTYVNTDVNC